MKLEHERQMFLSAMRNLASLGRPWQKVPWLESTLAADCNLAVGWPRGTCFKHRAAVAWCPSGDADALALGMECNPQSIMSYHGTTYFLYEDGYDVMAGTGALASIRQQQESQVLR